jgi:diguanylate cyclase (GGDEF)-like protein
MTTHINEVLKYSRNLTVLYVEDEKEIREHMKEVLENFFEKVIVAQNGKEGLERFIKHKKSFDHYPDLVLTDIQMPRLNGIEMSQKILALHSDQIIIMLSAHNDSNLLLEVINMGISYFLTKPFSLQQLNETLHKAAKRHFYEDMEVQYTKKMEKLANEDPLTGIANRRRFFANTKTLFGKNKSSHFPTYLFMMDIDKFKEINDTFGHDVGDEVIMTLVNIVQKESGKNDCFARFGGDEFVMVLQMPKEKIFSIINNIQKKINKVHTLLNSEIHFTVSIGMTEIESSDQDIDAVLKRADISLYNEKQAKEQQVSA